MGDAEWNYFGWQGVSFSKPENWELTEVRGSANKGYAELDDGSRVRLQLRWHKAGKKADMGAVAQRQAKIINRKSGGGQGKIRISDFSARGFSGKRFEYSDGGAESLYYILQCRDCLQVVLVGVFGEGAEKTGQIGERLIKSLRDHASDGKLIWSVFGFRLRVPAGLTMKKHSLRSGDLSLEFSEAGASAVFHRLSVANVLLKGTTLNRWVVDFMGRRYESVELGLVYAKDGAAEETVHLKGRERGRLGLVGKSVEGCFWNCGSGNSILGVVALGEGMDYSLDELARGVECR